MFIVVSSNVAAAPNQKQLILSALFLCFVFLCATVAVVQLKYSRSLE